MPAVPERCRSKCPERGPARLKLCRRDTDERSRSTYRDDVTRDEMARACMQNYDPAFDASARPGDILVSGYNFGTGKTFLV